MVTSVKAPEPPVMGGLMTSDRQKLLTVVDRLREVGINEEISLPQLAAVGDQSSGKSSLLEGITGFAFPVASDLCTRFATQIVMRRTTEISATISIIPGPNSRRDDNLCQQYKEFKTSLNDKELGPDAFASLYAKASTVMGLPSKIEDSAEPSAKRFSDDVLKIELNGPDLINLSVVDVPGLFHNPTIFQTEEDRAIIRNMINEYMNDERTIILAVMDARNNLANQEVFEMARRADPKGTRTVAVITKCDALQQGDEETVLRIARNEVEKLQYGWFVVRNRSTMEIQEGITIPQRHENERKFFNSSPWNQLQANHRGVPALKAFLGQLLYDHIRCEFPILTKEVEALYQAARENLEGLGAPRRTNTEQRQFLTRFASIYKKLVDDALRGNYDPSHQGHHPLKLRLCLRILDENFERNLRTKGHSKMFRNHDDEPDKEFHLRKTTGDKSDHDIYEWIRLHYRDTRGSELPGTVNPTLLENLFRQLTSKWHQIASGYLSLADNTIRDFIKAAHEQLVSDADLQKNILQVNLALSMESHKLATSQLEDLLADERGGILQTLNHYFADTVQKCRLERITARLKKLGIKGDTLYEVNLETIVGATHLSNEDQAINDIHDILKAYYKVAQKRFMDAVLINIRERCFVGQKSAIKKFTPEYVSGLSDEKLASIAEESFASSRERDEATQRYDMMSKALEIVRSV